MLLMIIFLIDCKTLQCIVSWLMDFAAPALNLVVIGCNFPFCWMAIIYIGHWWFCYYINSGYTVQNLHLWHIFIQEKLRTIATSEIVIHLPVRNKYEVPDKFWLYSMTYYKYIVSLSPFLYVTSAKLSSGLLLPHPHTSYFKFSFLFITLMLKIKILLKPNLLLGQLNIN